MTDTVETATAATGPEVTAVAAHVPPPMGSRARKPPPTLRGTDPLDEDLATRVKGAVWSIRQDYREAFRGLWVNTLAGSTFTPRALRFLMLKASAHDIRTPLLRPGVEIVGSHLHVGPGAAIARGTYFEALAPISVGHSTHIGPQVLVLTSVHPVDTAGHVSRQAELRGVTIGAKCFIGARTVVCPGVTIGDGVVVGANSTVVRDCLEPGVYAGSPAVLKRRFVPDA